MYIKFTSLLRCLLPKCPLCHICICVGVCLHAYVNITFCSCTGYTSVAFADHSMQNL